MLGISDAAEYLGMHTLGVKVTFEQLANEAMLPCILHWNQNHFVVCYGIKKKRFSDDYKIYIADPASQKLVYNKGEFCKCWLSTKMSGKDCGSALLLEPGVNFGSVEDEYKAREKSFVSFVKYFLPYKKLFFQLLLGNGVHAAGELGKPGIFPHHAAVFHADHHCGKRPVALGDAFQCVRL